MDAIFDPNEKFDFEKIILTPPLSSSNGNHFIKFRINENPLYIQTPKCRIKQGMVKTTKKAQETANKANLLEKARAADEFRRRYKRVKENNTRDRSKNKQKSNPK